MPRPSCSPCCSSRSPWRSTCGPSAGARGPRPRSSRRRCSSPSSRAGRGARRHVGFAFQVLALATLLVALARPHATLAVEAEKATVVVLTDRSGSMQAKDVAPTRLVAARRAASTFLDAVSGGVRVGAMAFNHQPTLLAARPRTTRRSNGSSRASRQPARRRPGMPSPPPCRPSRPRGPARPRRRRRRSSCCPTARASAGAPCCPVARAAARAKVPVYTVALGTSSGTITSRLTGKTTLVPPDTATLRQVAQVTGGQSFAIEDAARAQRGCTSGSARRWRPSSATRR